MTTNNDTVATVIAVLEEMTGDWDLGLDAPMDRNTQLIADLAFESIDIVQFVVALEQRLGRRNIPFEKLLMVEGRYVEDLSVGKIADFLAAHAQ